MSYTAIITKLENIRKHPNADRLNLANCLGYQVIVGLDVTENDIMGLFPDDGQLSHEYCQANNLYRVNDSEGRNIGDGYFDQNRRVKAQLLRKEKSEAFVAPVATLQFTGIDINSLNVGMKFTEINNIPICNKYLTKATREHSQSKKSSKKVNEELRRLFPEHMDTEQFRFASDFELVGLVTITSKHHGTSARSAHIKVPEENYKWYHRLLRINPKVKYHYKQLYGTRRVIKGEVPEYPDDYRTICAKKLEPHIEKNEIWYYEIVGFEETGKPIMNSVSTDKLPKELKKRFGNNIIYKYGCLPNTCDIYVYRITVQNDDGIIYELPWNQVKHRCKIAGMKHVPEIKSKIIDEENVHTLKEYIQKFMDECDIADPVDNTHVREGVCIRIDNSKTKIFKEKTFIFKVLEGIIKDSELFVDEEEIQSY